MKRIGLLFLIAAMLITTVIIWMAGKDTHFSPYDILQLGVIVLVVAFALFLGYKRTKSYRHGEPPEDELTKMMQTKTSSVSFYISLYMWLGIMFLSDKSKLAVHTLIGAGILGMAAIFAICWVVIYFKGLRNE
jgi:Ca2+/Na+ antiporter